MRLVALTQGAHDRAQAELSWVTRSPGDERDDRAVAGRRARPGRAARVATAGAGRGDRWRRPRRLALPVDQVGRDLVEEPGRRVVLRCAPGGADRRAGQVQPLAGPGDADVGEPPLLLELLGVAERAQVREGAVLHAGEEHDRELQALGGVQGHQRDDPGLLGLLGVGDLVGVGDERDPLEEVLEADHLAGLAALLVELPGHGDELGEVLDPGLVLGVVAGAQLGEVARAVEHGLEQVGDAGVLVVAHPAEVLEQRGEALDRGDRPGGDARGVLGAAQRRDERDALALGEGGDAGLGAVADAALGHVEDAAQVDRVAGLASTRR